MKTKNKYKYTPTKKRKGRKRNLSLKISNSKYQLLIKKRKSKKKMSSKEKRLLDDALYMKYCKCILKLEYGKNMKGLGYPICMDSVYKNRRFSPPKNASTNCNNIFNKNI